MCCTHILGVIESQDAFLIVLNLKYLKTQVNIIFNFCNLDRIFVKMRTDQRKVGGDEQAERGRKKMVSLCVT